MSSEAPTLEALAEILTDGLAAVNAAIRDRDAAPAPPASVEQEALKAAETAAADAKSHLDALITELRALDAAWAGVDDTTSAADLRQNAERRGGIAFDIWEARIAAAKAQIVALQARSALFTAHGVSTSPGFQVVMAIGEKVTRYRQRLESWRAGRDPRFSGLSAAIGEAKVHLDGLLLTPPPSSGSRPARRP